VDVRRFAIASILAVCLGGPVVETFDQWDHTLQDGNDTEANVVVVALCIGVAMSVASIVVARIRAMSSHSGGLIFASDPVRVLAPVSASLLPANSPPTPLRV
jgi:hypothetical protein